MTGNDALYALLARVGASHNGAAFFSAAELRDWPKAALAAFKKAELLTQAAPARGVICDGCERRCSMPVEIVVGPGRSTAFVVCDKRDDINRVDVALDRLVRWQASGEAVAVFLAGTLGITKRPGVLAQAQRWEVGGLKGKRTVPVVLRNADGLVLEVTGHSVPLIDVLSLKRRGLEVQRQALIDCIDNPKPGGRGNESPKQRAVRLQAAVDEKRARGVSDPMRATAAEEGVSRQMLHKILKPAKKP